MPLLVAVIVAVPMPLAVARPAEVIVAMPVLEDDHEIDAPLTAFPDASRAVARNY